VLETGRNPLEPDLGYTVDAAALKSPGVELHLLLLHLREAWRCRSIFLFNAVRVSM
jgi:3-dehydroquinate dehydratase